MLRLAHLPRARAINVRHTAPGHANPHFLDRARFLDPTHPAARLALRNLPVFVCPHFAIRAFPNAVLQEPTDFVPVNPLLATTLVEHALHTHDARETDTARAGYRRWANADAMKRHTKFLAARQLADARLATLAKRGRHNVGLIFHTSKKATSKSCVIRRRLRSKITAAIDLVVSRSADAVTSTPTLKLVSRPLQENEHLVLKGWTYLVVPDLAIYKTPLPNLVQAVRKALISLGHQSKRLESSWKQRPHKSQSATRTNRPPASEHPQDPDSTTQNVSTRLYANHPIILSDMKPAVRK